MSIQGTDEWFAERAAHITASKFSDVLAKGQGKTRSAYMRRLLAERLTGVPVQSYKNAAMVRGNEVEPLARMRYEAETGFIVQEVGFIKHPKIEWVGCSPDGLIGAKGVEIKCPDSTTHLDYIEANRLPLEYVAQVQGQMWVCGASEWDFVSFDDRFKDDSLQYFCITVKRDDEYIANLEAEVVKFLDELNEMVNRFTKDAA